MKLVSVAAIALFAAGPLQAQSAEKAKPQEEHHMMSSGWKEMDAFHKLLAATYHPVERSGDLKPLRKSANDLSAAARSWTATTPPKACNTESVRTSVSVISTDVLALANQVLAEASDAELKTAITAIHDKFESVEKACSPHAGHGAGAH